MTVEDLASKNIRLACYFTKLKTMPFIDKFLLSMAKAYFQAIPFDHDF